MDPFIEQNPVVSGMEANRSRVERVKENSARLAQAYASFTTTGDGNFQIADAVLFGTAFTEQPVVSYGYSLDGDQIDDGSPLPRSSGFVRKWVQDNAGLYTGAYVCMVIDTTVVKAQAPDPDPLPATNATPDPAPTPPGERPAEPMVFTDNFSRPNSALVGNGWMQTGGDWGLSNERVTTPDPSSYLVRPFGRVSLTVQADLRSPDGAHPCVFAWTNSTAGGRLGYSLAFAAKALGTNLVLYKSGKQVAAKHIGAANTAIGNVSKRLKLSVVHDGTTVVVKAFVDGAEQFTFTEPLGEAPTGTYVGLGNDDVGNVAGDTFVVGEVVVTPPPDTAPPGTPPTAEEAAPADPEATTDVPVYVIDHDFTFTAIAMKTLPEALLLGDDD